MLNLSTFLVKEHVGLLKLSNTYDIIDPANGQVVGLARERQPGWVHALKLLVSKQMLPTLVEIIGNPDERGEGKVLIAIRRGFTLFRAKVTVLAEGTTEVGHFRSKLFSLGGGFWLHDRGGARIGEVKGDWKGWNFRFLDAQGAEMGTITKKWAGIGKELFTSADTYVIALADRHRGDAGTVSLLLAAGIAIDTIFKEE
ncbi:MAG: oxidoreductase [Planctomycetes bacterium]|nr:oxidoreductase [Planctomycetota bacterium]